MRPCAYTNVLTPTMIDVEGQGKNAAQDGVPNNVNW